MSELEIKWYNKWRSWINKSSAYGYTFTPKNLWGLEILKARNRKLFDEYWHLFNI